MLSFTGLFSDHFLVFRGDQKKMKWRKCDFFFFSKYTQQVTFLPQVWKNKQRTKILLSFLSLLSFSGSTIIPIYDSVLSLFVPSETLQAPWSNQYEFRGHRHSHLNLCIRWEKFLLSFMMGRWRLVRFFN